MSIISKWTKKFAHQACRFHKDKQGQFAIIFAVTAVVLTLSSGLAVDGARLYSAKSKLDNAIDAAVLAATIDLTLGKIAEKDAEEYVGNFLYSNIDAASFNNAEVKIDNINLDKEAKTVRLNAHVMLPMTLTAIAGYHTMKVSSTSAAKYNDDKIEIAMALDVTGSMDEVIETSATGETKLEALVDAASGAVNTLIPNVDAGKRVRIGLVPYSASVNITPIMSKIQIKWGKSSQGCVIERTNSKRYTDDFSWGGNKVQAIPDFPQKYSACTPNEILPLTNNTANLISRIKSLDASHATAGHLGIAWAQYMLSSKWDNAWPGDNVTGSDAAPSTDKQTKKFAVIMTDGEFNTFLSNGNGGGAGISESRTYSENLCDNMKKNNIRIFTINFGGGTKAKELMAKCASPSTATDEFFFDASSSDELKKAFKAIAESIKGLRLIG